MNTIYISLGSDVGDRLQHLNLAKELVILKIGKIVSKSLIYETEPWQMNSRRWFLNQCIMIHTQVDPFSVMSLLLDIELQLGRKRSEIAIGYQPRIIDLDLIYFGDQIIASEQLNIPHPRLQFRRFVLIPLCELNDSYVHPKLKLTNKELLSRCEDSSAIRTYI